MMVVFHKSNKTSARIMRYSHCILVDLYHPTTRIHVSQLLIRSIQVTTSAKQSTSFFCIIYIFMHQNGSITRKKTYIQKYTRKTRTEAEICTPGYYDMGLFIAMETFKSLPFADVRQINHKIDL